LRYSLHEHAEPDRTSRQPLADFVKEEVRGLRGGLLVREVLGASFRPDAEPPVTADALRVGEPEGRHGEERLRLENVSVYPGGPSEKPAVDNVSFAVHAGEIVGLGGLQGAGASQLLLGLFGAYGKAVRGTVRLDGQPAGLATPRQAIEAGVALLTNDRKATGLILPLSIIANATLAALPELSAAGWRQPVRERAAAKRTTALMRLHAASLDLEVGALSGGNQQ
jgi:ribose transport system ATP-binding protein